LPVLIFGVVFCLSSEGTEVAEGVSFLQLARVIFPDPELGCCWWPGRRRPGTGDRVRLKGRKGEVVVVAIFAKDGRNERGQPVFEGSII
jgi:hypothetical protein